MTLEEKYREWLNSVDTVDLHSAFVAGAAAMAEIMEASAAYKDPSTRRERILLAMIQCEGFHGVSANDLAVAAIVADRVLDKGQDGLPVSKGLHND